MNLQPEWFNGKTLRVSGTQSCAELVATVERLRANSTQINFTPPLDPDEVWKEWQARQYALEQLDARQIRTLCLSPKTATRPELTRVLRANLQVVLRTPCLLGLINAYFINWEIVDHRQRSQELIRKALTEYS